MWITIVRKIAPKLPGYVNSQNMTRNRVLVTGSSRGIGRAIATKLAEEGWEIVLHASRASQEFESFKESLGDRCVAGVTSDLIYPSHASSFMNSVFALGPLHALVNNAGVYLPSKFAEDGDEVFEAMLRKTMAVNFESPMRLTRLFTKHALKHGHGKVLNVASRVGFRGEPGAAIYAASKAALINLTRSLAVEYAAKNIQFFGIAPGWVDTAMARDGMDDKLPAILESIPLGRMAGPEDCAATANFLLSESASYLSGVVIDINGASYFH